MSAIPRKHLMYNIQTSQKSTFSCTVFSNKQSYRAQFPTLLALEATHIFQYQFFWLVHITHPNWCNTQTAQLLPAYDPLVRITKSISSLKGNRPAYVNIGRPSVLAFVRTTRLLADAKAEPCKHQVREVRRRP